MIVGDTIFEQGEYKIVFEKNSFGQSAFIKGEKTGAAKGYHFVLLKNNVGYKWYATAIPASDYNPDIEKMKQEVIDVLKRFMV